jgi:hypothetical protein
MHRCTRLAQLLSITVLGFTTVAFAQETTEMPPPAESTSAAPAAAAEPGAAPVATEETPVATETGAAAVKAVDIPHYGLALRWRWVSVPGWFLGLFTKKNSPLSTFNCFALEGFWRKHDKEDHNRTWEIMVSVGYQNMSPPDGYWLGKSKQLTIDTDLVQVRGLGLITMDAAYVLRQYFSPYFGIHYGAGLGLGVVRGKVLRTSATCDPVTEKCQVIVPGTCGGANPPCTEDQLQATTASYNGNESVIDPHRFEETSVPSALPIINLLFGLDFPIPDAKGLEFHLEAGFYDAFFVGLSGGYVF